VSASLFENHRRQLNASGISSEVIDERGYFTMHRGSATDAAANLERLKALGVPKLGRDSDARLPGLVVPLYRPTGERSGVLYKPDHAPKNAAGKTCKYIASSGPGVIDVHPRNVERMVDPTVPLWITEGTKKADALTTRGQCAVSISGVYNWRSSGGTLGDWESICLKGREIMICFDSDAVQKKQVLEAMKRLGKWLKTKRVKKVWYVVTPPKFDDVRTKGVDDYFAAGGTLDGLREVASKSVPKFLGAEVNEFDDAHMAQVIADDGLAGRFVWSAGLGWRQWDGRRWDTCSDAAVEETVRQYCLTRFQQAVEEFVDAGVSGKSTEKAEGVMKGWQSMTSRGRRMHAVGGCKGILEVRAEQFDAHSDLLNTPDGIVDLRTGEVTSHDPEMYMTRITRGSYRPGFTHMDWVKALTAIPDDVRDWLQVRFGQGSTGHPTPDGRLLVLMGGGQNGKSLLTTDGILPALGDYGAPASHKLFMSTRGSEHSTEMADLRGQRLLIAEELTEGRSIDVTALKRIQDVGQIKARYVHRDNITFTASHTLMCTTNNVPVITETDHGTWRRLALVRFPYRFVNPGQPTEGPNDRPGDATLKMRIKAGQDGQHDAIVTWIVEGAMRWYEDDFGRDGVLEPPKRVLDDTLEWRAEADRILGYWRERLVHAEGSCIWAVDLIADFNRWLESNGHHPWPKETFQPRFSGHEETTRGGVEMRRVRRVTGLSRPSVVTAQAIPAQPAVYGGVRFRTALDDADLGVPVGVQTVQTLQETSQISTHVGEFPNGSAQSAQACTTPLRGLPLRAAAEPDDPW
jgi:putative DNA primase/helicase